MGNRGLSTECKICRSTKLLDQWRVNGYTIAHCVSCGFKFVRDEITEADLLIHYSNLYPEFDYEVNSPDLSFYYGTLKRLIEWECYGTEISSAVVSIGQKEFKKNH